MKQYIDKNVLVAEIERRIEELQDTYRKYAEKSNVTAMFLVGNCIKECKSILFFINSLETKNIEDFTDPLIEEAVSWIAQYKWNKKMIEDFKNYLKECQNISTKIK